MQNVVLVVHLLLAICLIAVVLLQRSEGGALGIGGGGGGGISSRGQTTPLAKLTWAIAVGFLATSVTLAVLAGGDPTGSSVLDEVGGPAGDGGGVVLPDLPPAGGEGGGDTPAAPPGAD